MTPSVENDSLGDPKIGQKSDKLTLGIDPRKNIQKLLENDVSLKGQTCDPATPVQSKHSSASVDFGHKNLYTYIDNCTQNVCKID